LSCKLKSLAFCYHVSVVCRVFVTDVLWLNGKSGKSAIVPLDRAIATFYRLSVVTMALSAAVWQQLSMHYFNLLVAYLKNESDRAKFFYSNQLMSHMEHDVSNLGCSPLFFYWVIKFVSSLCRFVWTLNSLKLFLEKNFLKLLTIS